MKIITVSKYLPISLTYAESQHENVKSMVLQPLINKPQGNKASSTKALLKQPNLNDRLQFVEMPHHLTFFKNKNCLHVGVPSLFNKMVSEKLDDRDREIIYENFNEKSMYPILIDFSKFKSDNFDSYSDERMNNIFNCTIWNDMYKKFSDEPSFKDYITLNKIFAEEIIKLYEDGDLIVVLDHSLWFLPQMIRDKINNVKIGVVCLQSMPNMEMFRTFVKPQNLIESLCCADFIEFQSNIDKEKFIMASAILNNTTTSNKKNDRKNIEKIHLQTTETQILIENFPIDVSKIKEILKSKECLDQIEKLKEKYKNKKIIISVCSQIHSNTTANVLMGIEAYLFKHGNGIALFLIEIPEGKQDFAAKNENHRMIEYINLNYESSLVESFSLLNDSQYYALLSIADVALLLNERSSFSKPALEFLVVNENGKGSLITSKFSKFTDNYEIKKVNPKNVIEIADSVYEILHTDENKIKSRNFENFKKIKEKTIDSWVSNLKNKFTAQINLKKIKEDLIEITEAYKNSKKRLFCLDYDGTLSQIFAKPKDAKPDDEILKLLDNLANDQKNTVCIITGRGFEVIDEWIPEKKIKIIAEHGLCLRENGEWTFKEFNSDWKNSARQCLEFFKMRTPGSAIEEKESSIVFHTRESDCKIRDIQNKSLKSVLLRIFDERSDIEICNGKCILEVKTSVSDKGESVLELLKNKYDFVFMAGDDKTDEDMFKLGIDNEKIYSVFVGNNETYAKYRINDYKAMRKYINELSNM
ncbi:hypothetical protein GVAV_001180 [Gurleya vavrai]